MSLVARRPWLGFVLLRLAWRSRARDWYRRPPFLPVPPARWLAWRMHTAFGDEDHVLDARELEHYVDWVRWMHPRRPRRD
jgi:hypothetical protein